MFKVEDGTGIEDATSYIDVSYADTFINTYYPEDTEWDSKSEAQKELSLMIATRFIDRLVRWNGEIFKRTQALKWPRTEFKDVDGRIIEAGTIPTKIKNAVAELALESLTGNIHDKGVMLDSQKYGSSSEVYSGPTRDGGNELVLRLLEDFKADGYGASSSSMIIVQRA